MEKNQTVKKIRDKYNIRNYHADDFRESDHPRDKGGRFTSGGGGNKSYDYKDDYNKLKKLMIENERKSYLPQYKDEVDENSLDDYDRGKLETLDAIDRDAKIIAETEEKKKKNPNVHYWSGDYAAERLNYNLNMLESSYRESKADYERNGDYETEYKYNKAAFDIASKIAKSVNFKRESWFS